MKNSNFSLALGLLVCDYDSHLIRRALFLAQRVYQERLKTIIIIRKEPVKLELEGLSSEVVVIDYLNNEVPQFFNMQKIYTHFLEKTKCTHLITIDPDTMILDWDQKFHDLAGQFIYFRKKLILQRFEVMPRKVNRHFAKIRQTGCIHSIQGGWSMRSRDICEKMAKHFFLDDEGEWNREQWRGHELFFGLYLKMSGIRHLRDAEEVRSVRDKKALYLTESASSFIDKKLHRIHVYHPVKTQEDFRWVMKFLEPDHRDQIKQWLKENSCCFCDDSTSNCECFL